MKRIFGKKIVALSLSALSLFGTIGLTSCSSEEGTTKLDTIAFDKSSADIKVGETNKISFKTSIASKEDLGFSLEDETIAHITLNENFLEVKGLKSGHTILNLFSKKDESVSAKIFINVFSDSTTEYILDVDTTNVKKTYFVGDELDLSNIEVKAYKYVNGIKQDDDFFYVEHYDSNLSNGDTLDTLGTQKITISNNYFGEVSFDVEVKNYITKTELTVDVSNVQRVFKKGEYFSLSGLKVYETSTTISLDKEGKKVEATKKEEISDYKSNIEKQTILENLGYKKVVISKGDASVDYSILITKEDTRLNDTAKNFYNTSNIGIKISSTIQNENSSFGFSKFISYKPYYFVETEYDKNSRTDESNASIKNEKCGLKDKNKNLVSAEIKDDKLINAQLIKKNVKTSETYWDYINYYNLGQFKDLTINNFPTITLNEDYGYYYQEVIPTKGDDNYETSLNSLPLLKGAFKLAGISKSYYKYVDSYELSAIDNKIQIKVNLDNYGYFKIETIDQKDNVDNELIKSNLGKAEFTFSSTVNSTMLDIKKAIQVNNYSLVSTNFTYYFTDNYCYFEYNPMFILYGISSYGIAKIKADNKLGLKEGIYSFTLNSTNLDEANLNSDSVTMMELPSLGVGLSYIDNWDQAIYQSSLIKTSSKLPITLCSSAFKNMLNNDELLATFSEIKGTNKFMKSSSADCGELIMTYIAGKTGDTRTEMENNGYIKAGIFPQYENDKINNLYLYALDENLMGYGVNLKTVGQVKIKAVEDYFKF